MPSFSNNSFSIPTCTRPSCDCSAGITHISRRHQDTTMASPGSLPGAATSLFYPTTTSLRPQCYHPSVLRLSLIHI